jgi:hypothetical protein
MFKYCCIHVKHIFNSAVSFVYERMIRLKTYLMQIRYKICYVNLIGNWQTLYHFVLLT